MTEELNFEELEFGDYDLDPELGDVEVVPASEAGPYPGDKPQDDGQEGLGGPGNAPRTPKEALAVARKMHQDNVYVGVGYCLKTVRGYYGVNSKYLSASESWAHAEHKRHVSSGRDVPRGVPVYWTGGSHGYGHIAISIGGGLCWSTDWKEPGQINVAYIDEITRQWGLAFQGYAWEVNDVVVWKPSPPRPQVSLSELKFGNSHPDVLEVKKALVEKGYKGMNLKSNKFGKGLQAAYKKYQTRLGYEGKDANGIPGRTSLRKLGFHVNP